MSARKAEPNVNEHAAAIQKGLADLKETYEAQNRADNIAASVPEGETPSAAFDGLTPVEQSAASLGVHPDSWKPIGVMNSSPYDTQRKSHARADTRARRSQAVRNLATSSQ